MRIAFYAPLKAPDHPVPSGDRLLARSLRLALARAGHRVVLASRLRAWEGAGDARRQRAIRRRAGAIAWRLAARLSRAAAHERPRCWFTYHLYHKAPDWIGPPVSRALGIPYVVAEASVSPRQAHGPWAEGHAAALEALRGAAAVVCINPVDVPGVRAAVGPRTRVLEVPPFLDPAPYDPARRDGARTALARRLGLPRDAVWIVTAAMMRADNKLDSFRLLARAAARLGREGWVLLVAGDGPARPEVERAFAPLGARRVRLLGRLSGEEMAALLPAGDVFAWPAVDEPIGMALLEAQACGLPVVAGAGRGVRAVLEHGRGGIVVREPGAEAFAAALETLVRDRDARRRLGAGAREAVLGRHALAGAAARLGALVEEVVAVRAAR